MATTAPAADRPHQAAKRYIYAWGAGGAEGNAKMRDLLGGKGANLAEMTKAGPARPAGLHDHDRGLQRLPRRRRQLPEACGTRSCAASRSVEERDRQAAWRSGEPTARLRPLRREVLDARDDGHDPQPRPQRRDREGIVALTGNARFAYDSYRRFVQMFCNGSCDGRARTRAFEEVLDARRRTRAGVTLDTDLDDEGMRGTRRPTFKLIGSRTGARLPRGPVGAAAICHPGGLRVLEQPARHRSTATKPASPHDLGTAVNVQSMVFGNMGDDCGTGVAFTPRPDHRREGPLRRVPDQRAGRGRRRRHPHAEEHRPARRRDAGRLPDSSATSASSWRTTTGTCRTSSSRSRAGRLYILQTRSGKRTARRGRADRRGHGRRGPDHARRGDRPRRPASRAAPAPTSRPEAGLPRSGTPIANGLNAGPGAAVGRAVFDADTAVDMAEPGSRSSSCGKTSPDDIRACSPPGGADRPRRRRSATRRVVAPPVSASPAVGGCNAAACGHARTAGRANGRSFSKGTRSASTAPRATCLRRGARPDGRAAGVEEHATFQTLLRWADEVRRTGRPRERGHARARPPRRVAFGAEGIGLCRTEHMFLGTAEIVRQMLWPPRRIQPGPPRTRPHVARGRAVDTAWLPRCSRADFDGIFDAMDGLPVVVRLIDPPLHEFLPHDPKSCSEVTPGRGATGAGRSDKELLAAVRTLHEMNPMLGLRGSRLA